MDIGLSVIRRGIPITPQVVAGQGVGVPVGETLPVEVGDTVRVHLTVDYRGPAVDGAIYIGIGWRVGVIIEQFVHTFTSRTPVHFEASDDLTPQEFNCDVDILTLPPAEELLYGTLLDMYAKIIEVPGADIYTPFYIGAIAWGKPIEEYELIQHTVYPFAYIYEGDQEYTAATFRTDPFVPSAWLADRFASKLEEEVRARGGRPLEVKVYVDTTPLFWTDFRIEVSSTPIDGVTEGVGVGIALWLAIILVCLAITAVIVAATLAFKTILAAFKTKPGLDDVKPSWGKETLILTIQDSEEYWERTPTTVETLEGMSEEDLRHLLNQIAAEEVPAGVEWAAVAVAGVVAAAVVVGGLALTGGGKQP